MEHQKCNMSLHCMWTTYHLKNIMC